MTSHFSFAATFALPILTVATLAASCEKSETTPPDTSSEPSEGSSSADAESSSTRPDERALKLADDSAFASGERHREVSATEPGDLLFINDNDMPFRLLIDGEEIDNQSFRHAIVRGLAPGEYEFAFVFGGMNGQSAKVEVVSDAVGGLRVGRWKSVGLATADDFVTLDGSESPPEGTDLVVLEPATASEAAPAASLAVGQSAPTLKLPGVSGGEVDTGTHAGKVVVIAFWASWSKPATKLLAELQEQHDARESDGLVVVGINTDDARSKSRARPLLESGGYTFPNAFDTNATELQAWSGAKEVPYVVVIDRDGVVQYVGSGDGLSGVVDGQL